MAAKPITEALVAQEELRARLERVKLERKVIGLQSRAARQVEKAYGDSYPSTRRSRLRSTQRGKGGSPDAHLDTRTLETMRRDCQQLHRGNPTVRAILQAMANMIVGKGPRVKPTGADTALNKRKAAMWAAWWNNVGKVRIKGETIDVGQFDIRGLQTGAMALHSLIQELATDGSQVWIKTASGSVQMIEAERLVGPYGQGQLTRVTDEGGWVGGIKVTREGRPTHFRIAPYSPEQMFVEFQKGEEVPADQCLFLRWPHKARNTQIHGEPGLQATVTRFEDLEKIDEAIRKSLYVAACFAAFITTPNPNQAMTAMAGMNVPVDPAAVQDRSSEEHKEIEPGMVQTLPMGSDIRQVAAQHPSLNHRDYVMLKLAESSADIGCPIVLALMDPNGANYGGLRAMLAMAFEGFFTWRDVLRLGAISPLYRFKMAQWIREGKLEYHDDWDAHDAIWRPVPVLNATEEYAAAEKAHQLQIRSTAELISSITGRDVDSVYAELAEEREMRAALGLDEPLHSGTPSRPADGSGAAPAPTPPPGPPAKSDDPNA